MKTVQTKIKKTIQAKVTAPDGKIKIKYPKQSLGNIGIFFEKPDGSQVLLKQFELILNGDSLQVLNLK